MNYSFNEEQMMLGETVYKWAKNWLEPQMEAVDEEDRFPENFFRETAKLDLNGITISEEYGGAELGYIEACIAAENMSRISGALAMTWGAHYMLCVDNVFRNGREEIKEKYLPSLIKGEKIGCLGITEPDAGSDAMSMRTTASRHEQGYLLNGSKTFITNGPIADLMLVYAKTSPEKAARGISAFLIETNVPGFTCNKIKKFGMRGSPTGEIAFNELFVSQGNLLGDEDAGVKILTSGLCTERIFYAACALGTIKAALDLSVAYSKQRTQFGKTIGRFQMIQQKLADLYTLYQSARCLVYYAAWYVDQLENKMGGKGSELDIIAATAFLYASEAATKACLEGVQIHGGYGYCLEYPIQRHLRDAKLWEIGGGTTEIRRLIIARELLQ